MILPTIPQQLWVHFFLKGPGPKKSVINYTEKFILVWSYQWENTSKVSEEQNIIKCQQYNYHCYNHLIVRAFLSGHVLEPKASIPLVTW